MKTRPFAGKPAEASMLLNVPRLITAYHTETPGAAVYERNDAKGTFHTEWEKKSES